MLPELGSGRKLLHVVEEWLRRERDGRRARSAASEACGRDAAAAGACDTASVVPSRTPLMPNKHLAFFR